ncbi:hypothetical protein STXM2123_5130 [Streptomyces sp. F-3]|nr:hypothetical protein STXM2123_5130 [Streptomyces sp. F-3]
MFECRTVGERFLCVTGTRAWCVRMYAGRVGSVRALSASLPVLRP